MSVKRRPDGKWRARYRDAEGHEHAKHFDRKIDAQTWEREQLSKLDAGTWVHPKQAALTVGEWCDTWLAGYATKRASTFRQASTHLKLIRAKFGDRKLSAIRPSEIRSWMSELQTEGRAPSYVYAIHARLSQLFSDAVHDGLLPKSPASRRTSPPAGKQRPYVATTEQVWALHDAMPDGLRPAVLLGAFAGLRVAEIAALRVSDVDFMRGIITPAIQYPSEPLKTEESKNPIPIPHELALMLNRIPAKWGSSTLVVSEIGRPISPYTIETHWIRARNRIEGLPEGFRIHDLRHYFASLLIAAGLDIKTVQARLRHASAKTTLDTYGHLWPDKDESARAAIAEVLATRADSVRTMAASSQ
jgi:integrase